MKILAVDPGVMTGYVYARITDDQQIEVFPFQMTDDVDEFWSRLKLFVPDAIVMEDFEFRGRSRTGLNLFPVQLIGIARLYELIEPTGKCQLVLQSAGVGKGYYTDVVLKKHGLYKRGIPHGMDALRHLLQWITFRGGYTYVDLKTGGKLATLLNEW
jgi:hypothetical protein